MIFKEKFKIQSKDIGKKNYVKNRGILEILENVATHHSDLAGYGPNDLERTKIVWVLLEWKMKILKRPKYGQILDVCTWGRSMKKAYTYRDFEIYDEQNNLCVIATSKWVIVNPETGRISRIEEKMAEEYQIEEKDVFNIGELDKITIPEEYSSEMTYKICRRDIDLNGHMHNLYYLDLAYEVLPQEVYDKRPFDNVRIQYKKELKIGDVIKCKYANRENEHIVTIYSEDCKKIHAVIVLK